MMADADEQSAAPIDVLLVVDDDVFDRLGSVVRHLCVGMMDEAVRVRVLSRNIGEAAGDSDAIGPSRVIMGPRKRWPWHNTTAAEALESIGSERPDIVHCLSADLAGWVQGWAAEWNCVLVVHLTDLVDVRQFRALRPAGRKMAIAATGSVERALLDKRPDMRDQVRVVPLGIPAASEPACLVHPERLPAVVVSTPLTRDCGLGAVLKALRKILDGGREVQLFVLAAGPAEPAFRRQVEQLGLRSHATFAGPMRDWATLREAMRGADFYIVPSSRRRFTVSTLTAMAGGLAVLAPAGTIEDYLIDGETGCLFEPQASGQLAGKWAALLDDRAAARKLAHGALHHVRTHHQASTMVSITAAVYRELCRARAARAGAGSG